MAEVAAQDLFVQIASDNPANVLMGSSIHPQLPINIASNYTGTSGYPIETNNYYGNLLVGDGTNPVYVMPYSVFWQTGKGLCAWNTDSTKYVFGSYSTESTPGPHYYYSGVGNCPIGLSSAEMDSSQTMITSNLGHQSVHVEFAPGNQAGSMVIPLVQGNAFLTSVYTNLTPQLFSGGAFTSFAPVTFKAGTGAAAGMSKYRVTVNNGDTWLVYLHASSGGSTTMTQTSNALYTGPAGFSGILQIAKLPLNFVTTDEEVFDSAAGTYATQNVISGTASGASASYNFNFAPASVSGNPLLSFLFPHQVASVSVGTSSSLKLWSNTKGQMQAYYGSSLSFTESDLPTDIHFLPWSPLGNLQNYSVPALQAIAAAANTEAAEVMSQQTDLNSMYYSGKALAKFAQICLTLNDVLSQDSSSCIKELEQNIALFISNQNQYPLIYDTTWKGAISSCGNSGCDFGNAWYNDHHFHYGYFIYTAAVIAHIDPTWLTTTNKAYINTLIRDFANPSTSDTMFPQFRSFDWYAGHSWAHGITASADGKDEESSSEDYNAIYGMKLWGQVIGDASMEARGNLMLAVMRRSMQSYMLMDSDNAIEPAAFVPQYAAGITFMNKVDHQTYFGQNEEYIEGIHMIPLTPISAYIRSPTFVAEEWSAVIEPILSGVDSGWLGILMANLAIANATASYKFFTSPSFSTNYLDGGASLTWYLTYAAGLGGAGDFQLAVNAANGVAATTAVTVVPTVGLASVSGSAINVAATVSLSPTTMSSFTSQEGIFSSESSSPLVAASSVLVSVAFALPTLSSSLMTDSSSFTSSASASHTVASGSQFMYSMPDTTSASADLFISSATSSALSFSSGSDESTTLAPSRARTTIDTASMKTSSEASSTMTQSATSSSTATNHQATASAATSSAPPEAIEAVTIVIDTNNGLSISCSAGSLAVGNECTAVTLYSNGTLVCDGLQASLELQKTTTFSNSVFDIDLALESTTLGLSANFTLNETSVLLFAAISSFSKRQVSAGEQQQLQFVYGSDGLLKAIPFNQNTTMTIVQLLARTPSSASPITSASPSAIDSFTVLVTTSSAPLPVTTTTSTTVFQTLTLSTTVHLSASASPISASIDVPSNHAGLAVNAQGAAIADVSSSTSVSSTGLQDNEPSGDLTSSMTVSYTTTINGQAALVTTVIPVTTVLITSTSTSTICLQCTATGVSISSAAAVALAATTSTTVGTTTFTDAAAQQSTAIAPAGAVAVSAAPELVSTAAARSTGLVSTGTSGNAASGSTTVPAGAPAVAVASGSVSTTVARLTSLVSTGTPSNAVSGSTNSTPTVNSSSTNSMPIVSSSDLPIYSSAADKLIGPLSGLLACFTTLFFML